MQKEKQLLIFDCDGVLVDSETLSNRIFVQCLQKEGFDIDEAYGWKHFYGIALHDCLTHLEEKFGRKVGDDFTETLSLLTAEEIKKNLQPIPGVDAALSQLPHPKCIASGSDHERLELSLEVTGLKKYFLHIFSAVDVPRGKPFPDIFLHAAKEMGFAPDDCIVIEDSEAGMKAGLAAGMRVCLYRPPGTNVNGFAVPENVNAFPSMLDLPSLIHSLHETPHKNLLH